MRATDIIRGVLDLLDKVDGPQPKIDIEVTPDVADEPGEQTSRFKHIFAMLDNSTDGDYANSPNPVVAPIEAVTTNAGGGLNGPKHPHDIRVKDPSAYPDQQEY